MPRRRTVRTVVDEDEEDILRGVINRTPIITTTATPTATTTSRTPIPTVTTVAPRISNTTTTTVPRINNTTTDNLTDRGSVYSPAIMGLLDTFSGEEHEIIEEWLDRVETIAGIGKWDSIGKSLVVASKLEGRAKRWYNAAGVVIRGQWTTLRLGLIKEFGYEHNSTGGIQKLTERKQGENEKVEDYSYAFLAMMKKYELVEAPWVIDMYRQGLLAKYREAVMRESPTTITRAIEIAKKEQLIQNSSHQYDHELKKEVQQLKDLVAQLVMQQTILIKQ